MLLGSATLLSLRDLMISVLVLMSSSWAADGMSGMNGCGGLLSVSLKCSAHLAL
jgi:hypothetical protein